jgi:hypothetical protein
MVDVGFLKQEIETIKNLSNESKQEKYLQTIQEVI